MAAKRMNTFIVTVRWKLRGPRGGELERKIAENGMTAFSARRKVIAYYTTAKRLKELGRPRVISVVRK